MIEGEPYIGKADNGALAGCRYAPGPEDPRCPRPAAFHVIVSCARDADYPDGMAGLPTCAEHLPVAESCGPVVTVHSYGMWCGFPSTRTSIEHNTCYLDTTQ